MRKPQRKLYNIIKIFGLKGLAMQLNIFGLRFFKNDLEELRKQKGADNSFPFGKQYPILDERFAVSGTMKGHYFHQDLYVARKIFRNNPVKHVDIGSRTDGFIAHLAVFREVELLDIRKQESNIPNIHFTQADLMQLPAHMTGYCDSVSSLHAIEHFGLGRYGDPIDYNGHLKAIANITHMLKPGGKFYFSVPIGKQRIEFNAHRVFSIGYLLELFEENYSLECFSYVDDKGAFHENIELTQIQTDTNLHCHFGCGIFELIKK